MIMTIKSELKYEWHVVMQRHDEYSKVEGI